MDPADLDFKFLLRAVRRLTKGLEGEVEAGSSGGGRGQVLANHVRHVLRAVNERLDDEESRYPERVSEVAKKSAATSLRHYGLLVWATHIALQWLRREEHQPLDLGALYFADETALSLLGPGLEIVPVESPEYMYSTLSWPFEWVLEKHLEEPLPEGPQPIILAFPAHERSSILLHCLFAHELGHAAVKQGDLVQKALKPLRDSGDFKAMLDDATENISSEYKPLATEQAEKLAELWVEELLCDNLAFALLGPSYLFAFAELGLSTGWSAPDEEHPSPALRSKTLTTFCKDIGWDQYLDAAVPKIWSWFEYVAAGPSIHPSTPAYSFASRVCLNSIDSVIQTSRDSVGGRLFKPNAWSGDCEDHFAELLENDILPVMAADDSSAGHREILLAAWLGAIKTHKNTPEAISKAVAEREYQRFVAKALEMSTAVRIWETIGSS